MLHNRKVKKRKKEREKEEEDNTYTIFYLYYCLVSIHDYYIFNIKLSREINNSFNVVIGTITTEN